MSALPGADPGRVFHVVPSGVGSGVGLVPVYTVPAGQRLMLQTLTWHIAPVAFVAVRRAAEIQWFSDDGSLIVEDAIVDPNIDMPSAAHQWTFAAALNLGVPTQIEKTTAPLTWVYTTQLPDLAMEPGYSVAINHVSPPADLQISAVHATFIELGPGEGGLAVAVPVYLVPEPRMAA